MNIAAIKANGNKSNVRVQNSKSNHRNLSFEARKFPSGVFEDDEIEMAKRVVNRIDDNWKKELKDWHFKKYHYESSGRYESDPGLDSSFLRTTTGILSLGVSELISCGSKSLDTLMHRDKGLEEAQKFANRISDLVDDLRNGNKGTKV